MAPVENGGNDGQSGLSVSAAAPDAAASYNNLLNGVDEPDQPPYRWVYSTIRRLAHAAARNEAINRQILRESWRPPAGG